MVERGGIVIEKRLNIPYGRSAHFSFLKRIQKMYGSWFIWAQFYGPFKNPYGFLAFIKGSQTPGEVNMIVRI